MKYSEKANKNRCGQ